MSATLPAETPTAFIPQPNVKLEAKLAKLQEQGALTPDDVRLNKKIAAVQEAIAKDALLQEQAYKRARGELAVPRVFGYRFTPSTSTPIRSEKRELRRAATRIVGPLSGRQWVKLRRMFKRTEALIKASQAESMAALEAVKIDHDAPIEGAVELPHQGVE